MVRFHSVTPNHLPKIESLTVATDSAMHIEGAQELVASADRLLADIDELARVRLAGTARNILGLDVLGIESPVVEAGRRVERRRGVEGFSPLTINAVFPQGVLCTKALAAVVRNFEAWEPDMDRDPNAIW